MVLASGVKQSLTTTGTGNVTLVAVTGCSTVADYCGGIELSFPYNFEDASGAILEQGIGYVSGGTGSTFVRAYVKKTFSGGVPTVVNSTTGQANLPAGTKYLVVTPDESSLPLNPPNAPIALHGTANKRIVMPDNCAPGTSAAFTLSGGTLWVWPVRFAHRGPYNAFAVRASAASGTIDVGLYAMKPDGSPGALIAGSTGVAAAAGQMFLTFSQISLIPGWYCMAINSSAGPGVYSQQPIDSCYGRADVATIEGVSYKAQAAGTLPNPFGAMTVGYSFAGSLPAIGLRHV
jgi:hypothetical protein